MYGQKIFGYNFVRGGGGISPDDDNGLTEVAGKKNLKKLLSIKKILYSLKLYFFRHWIKEKKKDVFLRFFILQQ